MSFFYIVIIIVILRYCNIKQLLKYFNIGMFSRRVLLRTNNFTILYGRQLDN